MKGVQEHWHGQLQNQEQAVTLGQLPVLTRRPAIHTPVQTKSVEASESPQYIVGITVVAAMSVRAVSTVGATWAMAEEGWSEAPGATALGCSIGSGGSRGICNMPKQRKVLEGHQKHIL